MSDQTNEEAPVDEDMKLDNHLSFSLYAAVHSYNKIYKALLGPLDLTYTQYLVMLALWERDDMTVKELGQRLLLDSGTLTPLLKRLEAAGRVRRSRDLEDERQVRITLTNEGRALKGDAAAIPLEVNRATGLGAPLIARLQKDLTGLRSGLENRDTRS